MSRRMRGFTLIEMLITVVVVAILLAVAVPGFAGFITRYRVEGATNELRTDLQYARSEAIRLQQTVELVTASGGSTYTIRCPACADFNPVIVSGDAKAVKQVTLPSGTSVSSSVTIGFEPLRGHASTAGSIDVSHSSAGTLRVVVDAVGKINTCIASGTFVGVSGTC